MATVPFDTTPLSDSSVTPHFIPLPESPPPSYNLARQDAERAGVAARCSGIKWVTVKIEDDSGPESKNPPPKPPFRVPESVQAIPRMPEFYETLYECDMVHAEMQAHAKGIRKAATQLYALQLKLCGIHEYWMEAGMNDIAHDVLPVLDTAKSMLPSPCFAPES